MSDHQGVPVAEVDPSAVSSDPHIVVPVHKKRIDGIIADRGIVDVVVDKGVEDFCTAIQDAQPSIFRTDPKVATCILCQAEDVVQRQTARIQRVVPVMMKAPGGRLKTIDSAAPHTDPYLSLSVLDHTGDIVGCKGSGLPAIMHKTGKSFPGRVQPADAAPEGGHPQAMFLIFQDIRDVVIAYGTGLRRGLFIDNAIAGGRVHLVQTTSFRTDPEIAGMVSPHAIDKIIGKPPRSGGIPDKGRFFLVETADTASPGADPEIAASILDDGFDIIVGKAGRIAGVIAVYGKLIAVIAVKPVLCAEPKKPHPVLQDTGDIALGKTVIGAEMAEFQIARLGE